MTASKLKRRSRWHPLTFGKHEGLTLPQVIFKDPDWFFWAFEEWDRSRLSSEIWAEMNAVHRRATSIRVPPRGEEAMGVEYLHQNGRAAGLQAVPATLIPDAAEEGVERSDRIDLSWPRRLRHYDKLGCSIVLRDMKEIVLGSASARMTKDRCEAFFEDPANFYVF